MSICDCSYCHSAVNFAAFTGHPDETALKQQAIELGIDPIQFSLMCVLNLVIGLTTPPVGVCLFVASAIAKVSIGRLTWALLPFIGVSLLVLLLVSYVPAVTLWLPNLVFSK